MRTCVRSRPGISEFGLRPTETRTLSNTFSRSFTSLPSKQTRMPFASSLTAVTVVFNRIDSKLFSSRLCSGRTRSRSAPGNKPAVISTTETFDPRAAYTLPNSSPMYPPPMTSSVPGTSFKSSADVESNMRGLSTLSEGMTAGRDPVAMMMRSKLSFSSPPPFRATRIVVEFSKPASLRTYCTFRIFAT